ncbi:MAG: hypothetical protein L0F96_02490 [Lactococcus lactis]|nr:hypothetical protein [Lactococcus lactis]MDN5446569.1 hypothetical protein [Lactococcus lactis]MDN5473929.1 hypothetical protein [Lactococcus lactis]
MSKSKTIIYASLFLIASTLSFVIVIAVQQLHEIRQLQFDQVKIEKRINNLTQAMQTKDKELEAGMRNNYVGLMYKIEFIERETGVGDKAE